MDYRPKAALFRRQRPQRPANLIAIHCRLNLPQEPVQLAAEVAEEEEEVVAEEVAAVAQYMSAAYTQVPVQLALAQVHASQALP